MRKSFVFTIFAVLLMFWVSKANSQTGRPIPPGVREADKQTNAPVESAAKLERKGANPAKLRQEAEELAKLSAGVPPQIDQLNRGQIAKDLPEELKRIEKLAKHLRSEITP